MIQLNSMNTNYRAYNKTYKNTYNPITPSFKAGLPEPSNNIYTKSWIKIVIALLIGTLTLGSINENEYNHTHLDDFTFNEGERNSIDFPHSHQEYYEKRVPKLRKPEAYIEPPKKGINPIKKKFINFIDLIS